MIFFRCQLKKKKNGDGGGGSGRSASVWGGAFSYETNKQHW